jgi:hypothetical protein
MGSNRDRMENPSVAIETGRARGHRPYKIGVFSVAIADSDRYSPTRIS